MSTSAARCSVPAVAIVGGGLAGVAAALAAAERGLRVELFEARRVLGGRAASFRDPASGEWIDLCQHVSMGCCTNLADFCRRAGIAQHFARHRRLHVIGPDGRRHDVAAAGWLPAPLHLLPSLLALEHLSLRERWHLLGTLGRLARRRPCADAVDQPIGPWLLEQGESDRAIREFWSPVLVGALSETLEHASLSAARQVFLDGFLASRRAYELEIPKSPLAEVFGHGVADCLGARGVTIHLGSRVQRIEGDRHGVREMLASGQTTARFDFYVAAVPWHAVRGLFGPGLREALPMLEGAARLQPAPITAVHLWFDRPITPLAHAILPGGLSQWLFQHAGGRCQVVISASRGLAGRRRGEIVAQVQAELARAFSAAARARLVRWRVITQGAAVFSVRPGSGAHRPAQHTPVPNLMLAGDWTATGWPGTMEGAVRSGYLAVEAILRALGRPEHVVVPDLPRGVLARWLIGPRTTAASPGQPGSFTAQ